MITPKKIGKAIAKKFKNWRGTTAPKETAIKELSTSSSKDFLKESEENILIIETATEQQTPVTTEIAINTTTSESCDNSNITTNAEYGNRLNAEYDDIFEQEVSSFLSAITLAELFVQCPFKSRLLNS
ncbi:hypothetical protein EUZ93_02900 [Wolbachia pipientis]|nr:hypothetical protein [Wolbachia pipientis]